MPDAAKEQQVLDLLVTTLNGIGPAGASWLTNPNDAVIGIPQDAVLDLSSPRLYVSHTSTVSAPGTTTTELVSVHMMRATFTIWLAASTHNKVLALKRDVVAALWAAEATFQQSFTTPIAVDSFSHSNALIKNGTWLGLLNLFIDYEADHDAP